MDFISFWEQLINCTPSPTKEDLDYLTAGEAHDLNGADVLPTNVQADAFLADKVYDAQERVIEKLQENVLDAKLRKYKH